MNPQTVLGRFSAPRMARYLNDAGSDSEAALQLYARQARVGAVLLHTIGHVEVVMRNAMHDALSAHSPDWYDGLSIVFNEQTKADILLARARVAKSGASETPGHIVAELNFGFWRFLLSKHYDRALWTPYLHRAFPLHSGRRDTVFDLVARVNDARNTIAHHQRIAKPKAVKRDSLELIGLMCADTQAWIRSECLVMETAV